MHLDITGDLTPARLQKTLKLIAGRPDAGVLENSIIRSLPQALYQPMNIGHFGLPLAEYAHFTSPIRRYPDLLVHRAIHHLVAHRTADGYRYGRKDVATLAERCSHGSRRAEEAEWAVAERLKCVFMEQCSPLATMACIS